MVLHTTDPSLSGLQSYPLRWSDRVLSVCSIFLEAKFFTWVVSFSSPSMRFLGHFFGVHCFNSLISRLKDTRVSLEYPHFCQAGYRHGFLVNLFCFHAIVKQENSEFNHCKSGPSVLCAFKKNKAKKSN